MMKNRWTLKDLPWRSFRKTQVDPTLLRIIKTASLVEYNAKEYGIYLRNIFHDNPEFLSHLDEWVQDEIKHGLALGRWAQKADPSFDLDHCLKRFNKVFEIPVDSTQSIRGSNSGELVSRCIVETGTSTFYTALGEACQEPLLKKICLSIASDEFAHYKFFYTHLQKQLEKEKLSKFKRLKIALGRIKETESDELSGAYYAANMPENADYSLVDCRHLYFGQVYKFYKPGHIQRMIHMVCKAVGISPQKSWIHPLGNLYFKIFLSKHSKKAS